MIYVVSPPVRVGRACFDELVEEIKASLPFGAADCGPGVYR